MRDYDRLSKILRYDELLYLEDLIPEETKYKDLRDLIIAARRWKHQIGKTEHSEKEPRR